MKHQIHISGICRLDGKAFPFKGIVLVEERRDSFYYTWNLFDENGKSIAGKSVPITFRQIPSDQLKIEYAKTHAIEAIRSFRIGREKNILNLSIRDSHLF